MKKISFNPKHSILCLIIIFGIGIGACQNNFFMNKYEWTAGITAARYYPAYIISGGFSYLGGSVYIPDDRVLSLGRWGASSTTHVVGEDFKPVPESFDISWLCLAENQSYAGSFELPTKKIDSLFKTGFTDRLRRQDTYNQLTVGVAPGGVVIVWANGAGQDTEIGRFQAHKISPIDIKKLMPSSSYKDTDDFRNFNLDLLDEEAKAALDVDNIPFGLWDKYRLLYIWNPIFEFDSEGVLTEIVTRYFNGETYYVAADNTLLKDRINQPLPVSFKITWKNPDNNYYGSRIYFDEKEIFEVFETFQKNSKTTKVKLIVKVDKYNSSLRIFVNDETGYQIELTKSVIKIYTVTP